MIKNAILSGIKYTNFEDLPYLNKASLSLALGKKGSALNYWVRRLVKTGELIPLKNGLFTSNAFLLKIRDRPLLLDSYREHLAGILRHPSYISLEYVLAKNDVIPDLPFAITSITQKSSRTFSNNLGTFIYRNINQALFTGYVRSSFLDKRYFTATTAKALFDYLYLKNLGRSGYERMLADDLRINWDALKKPDAEEFQKYVALSRQRKMEKIMKIILKRNLICS